MVFKIGLLPIVLGVLLLGMFAGKIARRLGKNPLVWGILTISVVTAATWQYIPIWSETIVYRSKPGGRFASPEPIVTRLAEAEKTHILLSMDGVNFDVPLVYNFKAYSRQLHGWPNVPGKVLEGKQRPVVDFIKIDAMLPGISPLGAENIAQFEKLAWAQSLHASISHRVAWDDYFKYFFEKLQRQAESKQLPGMLHFYDPTANASIYLSHDHPTDDLIRIRCPDENAIHEGIPICVVETAYYPESEVAKSMSGKDAVFHLRYELPMQYIEDWRTIGHKLKSRINPMVSHS